MVVVHVFRKPSVGSLPRRRISGFRRAWAKARKEARLEGRIFHDFRRTGARRLINAGVSQAVAMRVTGHRTPSMFRPYQIVEKEDVAAALEKVAAREERPRVPV